MKTAARITRRPAGYWQRCQAAGPWRTTPSRPIVTFRRIAEGSDNATEPNELLQISMAIEPASARHSDAGGRPCCPILPAKRGNSATMHLRRRCPLCQGCHKARWSMRSQRKRVPPNAQHREILRGNVPEGLSLHLCEYRQLPKSGDSTERRMRGIARRHGGIGWAQSLQFVQEIEKRFGHSFASALMFNGRKRYHDADRLDGGHPKIR